MNSTGLRDNHNRGKVAEFLAERIKNGSKLSVVSAYFTIYAYDALKEVLDRISNPAYPRFLVLDDALIGLEIQNRLPVLRIITSESFKNYQLFLLTHDRVWFDLARGYLREKDGWLHQDAFLAVV